MTRNVAFLRGINLGRRRVKMNDLKAIFEELGYRNVETFIASGNVIFECPEATGEELTLQIESHLQVRLGYPVDSFVRTFSEVEALAKYTPFPKASPTDTINVSFFRETFQPDQITALGRCQTDLDEFVIRGRELYWLCRIKMSQSTIWQSSEIRALALPTSSMRKLATVQRLVSKFGE